MTKTKKRQIVKTILVALILIAMLCTVVAVICEEDKPDPRLQQLYGTYEAKGIVIGRHETILWGPNSILKDVEYKDTWEHLNSYLDKVGMTLQVVEGKIIFGGTMQNKEMGYKISKIKGGEKAKYVDIDMTFLIDDEEHQKSISGGHIDSDLSDANRDANFSTLTNCFYFWIPGVVHNGKHQEIELAYVMKKEIKK